MNKQNQIYKKLRQLQDIIVEKYNGDNYLVNIEEFLSHFELGLAFEFICTALAFEKIKVTKDDFFEIRSIGEYFGMDDIFWKDIIIGNDSEKKQ